MSSNRVCQKANIKKFQFSYSTVLFATSNKICSIEQICGRHTSSARNVSATICQHHHHHRSSNQNIIILYRYTHQHDTGANPFHICLYEYRSSTPSRTMQVSGLPDRQAMIISGWLCALPVERIMQCAVPTWPMWPRGNMAHQPAFSSSWSTRSTRSFYSPRGEPQTLRHRMNKTHRSEQRTSFPSCWQARIAPTLRQHVHTHTHTDTRTRNNAHACIMFSILAVRLHYQAIIIRICVVCIEMAMMWCCFGVHAPHGTERTTEFHSL